MAVYQHKSGRWYYKFYIRGKQYHKAIPEATTKLQAEKAENIVKASLFQGKYDYVEDMGEMLFHKLADVFMEYSKNNKRSWRSDKSRVNYLTDFFKNKKLREISPILIEQYKIKRKKQKTRRGGEVSNTSINRELEILRKMFNIAIKNRWAIKNPVVEVEKLKQENKVERFLQPEEETRLLNNCIKRYKHLKPFILMALHTGMRLGEILNLKWSNVNLKEGYIVLTRTKSNQIRKIPLSTTLLNELKQRDQSLEYVFTNPKTGKQYSWIANGWTGLCKAANIEGLRFHDLRHTAATRMVSKGIDLVVVQEILGHANLTTTQRYSHPVPIRKLEAIQVLESFA